MSELTLVQKEQIDRYVAAVEAMHAELEAAGIVPLGEFDDFMSRQIAYSINHDSNEPRYTLMAVVNSKNQQSVFNASQITLIKKYRGGYHNKSGYWYVRRFTHTEF